MALLEYKLKSNRKVVVELLSSRVAVITAPAAYITVVKENSKISSISFEDQITFKKGDELIFKLEGKINSPFKIIEIIKYEEQPKDPKYHKDKTYIITCADKTHSTYFLLPLLSKEKIEDRYWWQVDKYIINVYIGSKNSLILETRYYPTEEYKKFEDMLKNHPNYLDFKDVNYFTVAYKFYIGDQHLYDLELFKHGKYSRMSEAAINKIKNFYRGTEWYKSLVEVLEKSPSKRKKMEEEFGVEIPEHIDLYSKPDLTIECYADII